MSRVISVWRVPPDREASEPFVDFSAQYHEMIRAGVSPSGRVHPGRFWRLSELGDSYVFRSGRIPASRLTASIILLWDFSSSQNQWKPALLHSLDVIGTALHRLKVNVWAGAYTTGTSDTDIYEVCNFREPWDSRRVATLDTVKMGGTPTGLALRWVRQALLPRSPDRRKLILVCTDGQPGDINLQHQEIEILKTEATVCGLYVGSGGGQELLKRQYGDRYAFYCPDREDIPQAFNEILLRIRG